jgi:hypothetical protein
VGAAFLLYALTISYLGQGEDSGFIKATQPTRPDLSVNSLLGYSVTIEGTPLFKENLPAFQDVLLYDGAQAGVTLYTVRGLYPFIAALASPFASLFPIFALINLLCWLLGGYACWRFTGRIVPDPLARLLGLLFVAGGFGWHLHAGDYSAHDVSFVSYYLGVLLLYESGVWCERRPLRTHLIIGVLLGLANLAYSNGVMLLIGYVLQGNRM